MLQGVGAGKELEITSVSMYRYRAVIIKRAGYCYVGCQKTLAIPEKSMSVLNTCVNKKKKWDKLTSEYG